MKIRKGDQVVLPPDSLQLSLNPLKSRAHFSRYGMQWYAEQIHIENLPNKKDGIDNELERLERQCDEILRSSSMLEGLDIANSEDAEPAIERLKSHRDSPEWWAFLSGVFLSAVRSALENNDIHQAIWGMGCAERCRSMVVFKEHLEEAVWIGQSAKRVVDMLRTWDGNRENSDEAFWQATFKENVYALSQVFAVPLVFIKDAAYVGGMNISRKNAKLADYLFSLESSGEAVLIEIKTPVTKLLGAKYRGTYRPSAEITGTMMQALDYRGTLVKHLSSVTEGSNHKLEAFGPRCVVIAGNGSAQLNSQEKRYAFEQFRTNSKDVEFVTYDELFRKLEVLASLFNLVRAAPVQTRPESRG